MATLLQKYYKYIKLVSQLLTGIQTNAKINIKEVIHFAHDCKIEKVKL